MTGEAHAASPAPVDWDALRAAAERALLDPTGARIAYNAVTDAGYCVHCWIRTGYQYRFPLDPVVGCLVCGRLPRRSVIIGGQWMLSTADMARLLQVSPRRVRKLIADGRIPQSVRVGSAWYVPADSGWDAIAPRPSGNPNWRKSPA
jgi:excisionase family DNA binding protein